MTHLVSQKIAIIYDWMDKWGGVERVLLTLHEMFPHADFYTSYYDSQGAQWAKDFSIHTSFIQQLPSFIKKSRILSLPLYPYAFESFRLNSYDLVISVTSSFAKAVITRPETRHFCYLLTPTRFLWTYPEEYTQGAFSLVKQSYATGLREWDYIAAQRPDSISAISQTVASRCQTFYNRIADVIYPPFDSEYWNSIDEKLQQKEVSLQNNFPFLHQKKYYLVVSRLERYKKVEVAIKVFNKRPEDTLVVVGAGTQWQELSHKAGNNIIFLQNISDLELGLLYNNAEALIMSQDEDFGYVALEAQYFSCPVIAFAKGGATETVIPEKTGLLFTQQTVSSLEQTLERFTQISYNVKNSLAEIRYQHIQQFSKESFIKKMNKRIADSM